jgi:hypothetical protein
MQMTGVQMASVIDAPALSRNGHWGTVGGLALEEAISIGSLDSAMDLFDGLTAPQMASLVSEAGVAVPAGVIEKGSQATSNYIARALTQVMEMQTVGQEAVGQESRKLESSLSQSSAQWGMNGFGGQMDAARAIQAVFAARGVDVSLYGDESFANRGALLCIGAQALEADRQGFGCDGLPGKFKVPLPLHDVLDLYRTASGKLAVETVCEAMDVWRGGGKVGEMTPFVPDSIQRVLQGSLSENAAHTLRRAVENGTVEKYANDVGEHAAIRLFGDQGIDVHAPTIKEQAETLGLAIAEPDRQRGKYMGPMVGADHRAGLVKYARSYAVELPFASLDAEQARPALGDMVRMEFKNQHIKISVTERGSSRDMGR